jgi:hypothetical protein
MISVFYFYSALKPEFVEHIIAQAIQKYVPLEVSTDYTTFITYNFLCEKFSAAKM